MNAAGMGNFWDRRAGENPLFYVDSRLEYSDPDADRFWAGGERDLDRLLGAVGERVEPGDEVVEIGCGVGRLTRVLARRAANVTALDVSPRMLELARELNPGLEIEWMLGDGETLRPLADRSADLCVSLVVFQHIPDPEVTLGYIEEVGRVLRPGGRAVLHLSNDPGAHRAPGLASRARRFPAVLRNRGPRGQGAKEWLGSAVELDEVGKTAASAGLTVDQIVGAGTQWCAVRLLKEAGA